MGRGVFLKRALIFGALLLGVKLLRDSALSDIRNAIDHPNVKAFLAMIRRFESAGKYDVIYGGQKFASFAEHPQIRVAFIDPRNGKENYSTAAGAYQITYPTWLTIQAVAALPDFSPRSQDLAAVTLLKIRGALGYVIAGDMDNALRVASKTWASLPYTDSQQRHVTVDVALSTYTANGGTYARTTG